VRELTEVRGHAFACSRRGSSDEVNYALRIWRVDRPRSPTSIKLIASLCWELCRVDARGTCRDRLGFSVCTWAGPRRIVGDAVCVYEVGMALLSATQMESCIFVLPYLVY
jgi:hypothetical protein